MIRRWKDWGGDSDVVGGEICYDCCSVKCDECNLTIDGNYFYSDAPNDYQFCEKCALKEFPTMIKVAIGNECCESCDSKSDMDYDNPDDYDLLTLYFYNGKWYCEECLLDELANRI